MRGKMEKEADKRDDGKGWFRQGRAAKKCAIGMKRGTGDGQGR